MPFGHFPLMIERRLTERLLKLAKGFPIISVTGPRQSGKTTLVRATFSGHRYVSLESLDTRMAATEDPRRFLGDFAGDAFILDEVQRVPELLSYLQGYVDEKPRMGRVVLTGSQNFLLMEGITQTLAGRAAVEHLLPFEQSELGTNARSADEAMVLGGYPPVFDRHLDPSDFYPAYIETYVERDVRSIRNIGDLNQFRKFLRLCAGRTGQLLNLSALGNEAGMDHKTVQSWISVLEASFVVFRLLPHHRNWNKRLVKQPKLYFLDTGVACSLLGIRDAATLATHPLRGALFETYIVSEALKFYHHRGIRPPLSFWRDHSDTEVDLLIELAGTILPCEIKSGETVTEGMLAGLKKFEKITEAPLARSRLVHGGTASISRTIADVFPWNRLDWPTGLLPK